MHHRGKNIPRGNPTSGRNFERLLTIFELKYLVELELAVLTWDLQREICLGSKKLGSIFFID